MGPFNLDLPRFDYILFIFQTEMQKEFNHKEADFTLEKIIEFGFDQFADTITDVSGAATKELAIELVCYCPVNKQFSSRRIL